MSLKIAIIILVDIVILLVVGKLIFKRFKNFLRAIYFIFYPNIVSIVENKFHRDTVYTYRLLGFILLIIAIVLIEIKFFY
jgi:hypothetical protein